MYVVYVLRSKTDKRKLYIGTTSNFENRIAEHNKGKVSYSKLYRPWQVEVKIVLKYKQVAYGLEKYLKSGSGFAFLKKHFLP